MRSINLAINPVIFLFFKQQRKKNKSYCFDTLSTYLYQFASDEMIEKTAVASLFILAMSTIPVGVLCYSIKKHSAKL